MAPVSLWPLEGLKLCLAGGIDPHYGICEIDNQVLEFKKTVQCDSE